MEPENYSFYKNLVALTVPIAIQQLFVSGLGMVDVMLVGQLGDTRVAAVGLATQVYFILSLLYFGMSSGSAIFTAQFWGKHDTASIQKVLSLNMISNFLIGLIFTIISQAIPREIINLFSSDPQVIQLGSEFLRIFSIGFIFTGLSYSIYVMLRSTESVKIPMYVGGAALCLSTLLGYLLIFGKIGMPALGINGAAVANTTARVVEFIAIIAITRFMPGRMAVRPKLDFPISRDFIRRYLVTAMPVTANELIWSVGVSVYSSVYAHIGTESITATNISTTIENLAFVPFIGLGNACAIIIGKKIGAGEMDRAYQYAKKVLAITFITAVLMGSLIFLTRGLILDIYKISDTSKFFAHWVLVVLAIGLLAKSTNMIIIIGVIRAGGDTKYGLLVELSTMWLYGVPAAFVAARIFQLPVYWVVAAVAFEEVVKLGIISYRFLSKKWIHNLAQPAV